MFLKLLHIKNFRNYDSFEVEFSKTINFIVGGNAQGKTNLLEAIYLLCLARSFRGVADDELVRFAQSDYELNARFLSDLELEDRVTLMYTKARGKQIAINGKRLNRFSDLIGRYPIISLTSTDHQITAGPPADRRHFFDVLLSQISSKYLENLREYRRILKQKNKILHELFTGHRSIHRATLDAWNQRLVSIGTQIILDRESYCKHISDEFDRLYNIIASTEVKCEIIYRPNVPLRAETNIESVFTSQLAEKTQAELKSGLSLVGPHRDEFTMLINGIELRKFGSRGEHKTALAALKGSELQLIIRRRKEQPILLLDDLYSELDLERSTQISKIFRNQCQIFISATLMDLKILRAADEDLFSAGRIFNVINGTIQIMQDEQRF